MLLPLAALLLSPNATGPLPVAADAAEPAPSRDAKALAELLAPDAAMLRLAADAARRGAGARVAGGDAGLSAHVGDKLVDEVTKLARKELPGFRREIAGLLQDDLNEKELADALTFFASPAGTRMMAVVYEVIGEDPGRPRAEIERLVTQRLVSRIQPGDLGTLMAFGASPVAGKARAAAARMSAAGRNWSDRFVAKHRKALDKLVTRETKRYLRDHRDEREGKAS